MKKLGKDIVIPDRWFKRLAFWLKDVGQKGFWGDDQYKLLSIGGHRIIYRERREKYLERFYVLSTPFFGIYLHRFWADDEDGLHDHPWHSISVLLEGSYKEEMPESQKYKYGPTIVKLRRPRSPWFYFRKRTDAHRITIPKGEEGTWSLFIRFGLKRKTWGFYNDGDWVPAPVQSRRHEVKGSLCFAAND